MHSRAVNPIREDIPTIHSRGFRARLVLAIEIIGERIATRIVFTPMSLRLRLWLLPA
jgi:hypothetical protein